MSDTPKTDERITADGFCNYCNSYILCAGCKREIGVQMTTLFAFDPGVTGAVAVHCAGMSFVHDLPTRERSGGFVKREIDAGRLDVLLSTYGPGAAILEMTSAMPGQGVASMFSMGVSRGIILGVLGARGVPTTEVAPRVWKSSFGLTSKDKEASLTLARGQYPSLAKQLARKSDHNRAEALLLLTYLMARPELWK